MDYYRLTDVQRIGLILEKDDDRAWKALVHVHRSQLLRYLNACAPRGTAKDLLEEFLLENVWLRVYDSLPRYRENKGSFVNWLYKKAREELRVSTGTTLEELPDDGASEEPQP